MIEKSYSTGSGQTTDKLVEANCTLRWIVQNNHQDYRSAFIEFWQMFGCYSLYVKKHIHGVGIYEQNILKHEIRFEIVGDLVKIDFYSFGNVDSQIIDLVKRFMIIL